MSDLVVYGPAYSVYTRIVRMTLVEKGQDYRFEEVDFISEGMPAAQVARHPFGVVPALEHEGRILCETSSICVYLDEVFAAPALRPADAFGRACVAERVAAFDHYLWPDMRDLVTQSLFAPMVGGWPDESIVERATKRLARTLRIVEDTFLSDGFMAGGQFSLADLHAGAMVDYIVQTVAGAGLVADLPNLKAWRDMMRHHPSLAATEIDFDAYEWTRRD